MNDAFGQVLAAPAADMRGMIFGDVPNFADIVARVRRLEDELRS